jgi:hypothetical protein
MLGIMLAGVRSTSFAVATQGGGGGALESRRGRVKSCVLQKCPLGVSIHFKN